MTSFADYLNDEKAENIDEQSIDTNEDDLNENVTPKPYMPSKPSLQDLQVTMQTLDFLYGQGSVVPLDMKIKKMNVYFIWYDENERRYNISTFNAKHGVGSMPDEMDIPTLKEAKDMLRTM